MSRCPADNLRDLGSWERIACTAGSDLAGDDGESGGCAKSCRRGSHLGKKAGRLAGGSGSDGRKRGVGGFVLRRSCQTVFLAVLSVSYAYRSLLPGLRRYPGHASIGARQFRGGASAECAGSLRTAACHPLCASSQAGSVTWVDPVDDALGDSAIWCATEYTDLSVSLLGALKIQNLWGL